MPVHSPSSRRPRRLRRSAPHLRPHRSPPHPPQRRLPATLAPLDALGRTCAPPRSSRTPSRRGRTPPSRALRSPRLTVPRATPSAATASTVLIAATRLCPPRHHQRPRRCRRWSQPHWPSPPQGSSRQTLTPPVPRRGGPLVAHLLLRPATHSVTVIGTQPRRPPPPSRRPGRPPSRGPPPATRLRRSPSLDRLGQARRRRHVPPHRLLRRPWRAGGPPRRPDAAG